jgi:hypothetical protein
MIGSPNKQKVDSGKVKQSTEKVSNDRTIESKNVKRSTAQMIE